MGGPQVRHGVRRHIPLEVHAAVLPTGREPSFGWQYPASAGRLPESRRAEEPKSRKRLTRRAFGWSKFPRQLPN